MTLSTRSIARSAVFLILIALALASMLTLAACEEEKEEDVTYTVTLNYNNGGSDKKITVDSGSAYGPPTTGFSRTSFGLSKWEFKGWFIDSACTIPWTSKDIVTNNITLYAKWEEHKFTLPNPA